MRRGVAFNAVHMVQTAEIGLALKAFRGDWLDWTFALPL